MPSSKNERFVRRYLTGFARAVSKIPVASILQVLDVLIEAERSGRTIYVMGNGGSASTANHIACDLSRRFPDYRPGFRIISLAANEANLTAWANDLGYETIFARQMDGWVREGDVVVAVSVSGNSLNILEGLRFAKKRGAACISFLGRDGGKAKRLSDHTILVASEDYGFVETAHLLLDHLFAAYFAQQSP